MAPHLTTNWALLSAFGGLIRPLVLGPTPVQMAIFSVALHHAFLWLLPQMCSDSNRFPSEGAEKQVLIDVYAHPRTA